MIVGDGRVADQERGAIEARGREHGSRLELHGAERREGLGIRGVELECSQEQLVGGVEGFGWARLVRLGDAKDNGRWRGAESASYIP